MSVENSVRGVNGSSASPQNIGRTTGRYLLGIHHLSTQGETRVSTGELREYLDVSPASTTEMISKLDDRNLVDYEKYRGVVLTEEGEAVATRLAWQRCVVTNFFDSTLDTDLDDQTSYEIGFTLPGEAVTRLRKLVNHPCRESSPERRLESNR